jgi:hypothetical protein
VSSKIKIIFLDVDGTIITERTRAAFETSHDRLTLSPEFLNKKAVDPVALALLNKIIDITNAKIVITSSQRLTHLVKAEDGSVSFNLANLKTYLEFLGVHGELIAATPQLEQNATHCSEIRSWFAKLVEQNKGLNPVEGYVIFDTDARDHECFGANFIQTIANNGLQYEDFVAACTILGAKDIEEEKRKSEV